MNHLLKGKDELDIKKLENDPISFVKDVLLGNSTFSKRDARTALQTMEHSYKINKERTARDSYVSQFQVEQHNSFKVGEALYKESLKLLKEGV